PGSFVVGSFLVGRCWFGCCCVGIRCRLLRGLGGIRFVVGVLFGSCGVRGRHVFASITSLSGGVVCPHIGQCAGSRELEGRVGVGVVHYGLGVDQFVHADGAVFTTGEELFEEWLLARQHVVRRPE